MLEEHLESSEGEEPQDEWESGGLEYWREEPEAPAGVAVATRGDAYVTALLVLGASVQRQCDDSRSGNGFAVSHHAAASGNSDMLRALHR